MGSAADTAIAATPMTSKKNWRYVGSLIAAGLVSLFSSLFGCFWILGALFSYPHFSKESTPFLLLVLAFPLFVLASLISSRLILLLWAMTFIYPFAMILLATNIVTKSFLSFLVGTGTMSLALSAVLLQYSTRFNGVPDGTNSQGVKFASKD